MIKQKKSKAKPEADPDRAWRESRKQIPLMEVGQGQVQGPATPPKVEGGLSVKISRN
jgi:hypothetical protein